MIDNMCNQDYYRMYKNCYNVGMEEEYCECRDETMTDAHDDAYKLYNRDSKFPGIYIPNDEYPERKNL